MSASGDLPGGIQTGDRSMVLQCEYLAMVVDLDAAHAMMDLGQQADGVEGGMCDWLEVFGQRFAKLGIAPMVIDRW